MQGLSLVSIQDRVGEDGKVDGTTHFSIAILTEKRVSLVSERTSPKCSG